MNLKEIIKNNGIYVKNIIKKITNEYNEDLEQEVYIKVLKNADKYEEKGNFKAWISTIASNISKDYLKSSQTKLQQASTSNEDCVINLNDKRQTPEMRLLQLERQKIIADAIDKLKPKFKEVILLSEIEEYTYEEISKKINCPIGTVKSRLFNAKKELAVKLEKLL